MTTKETIHSSLAIPPGEYLEEVIAEQGMTKEELARRMGRPATKLSPIFKGEKAITPDTALQLERVVGVPAHVWTGLESEYRLTLARNVEAEHEKECQAEASLVPKFCYPELVKLGEAPDTRKPAERVRALQAYLGVASLHSALGSQRYQAAFRCGKAGERSPEAVAAWLRLGERRGQKLSCAPYDETRLRNALDDLRAMTQLRPVEFKSCLTSKLSECGVALVICPHFPKTRAHGATFWLGREKAVLMLTIRGKWADIFWFSLFHEIGHILLHGKQAVILEDDESNEREKEADSFASNVLIPEDAYRRFRAQGRFYADDVKAFAEKLGIHPGIVVGRLQHDAMLNPEWLNEMRVRYEFAKTPPRSER
jgi:HTH-type transcriptional regulator/antitoxin HigA